MRARPPTLGRVAAVLLLAACPGRGSPAASETPAPDQAQAPNLPPAGFGTLRRDEIAVRLATDQLQVTVLPLDERVTRLLATDTYNSLRQLVESRQGEIQATAARAGVQRPTLVFVQFFGMQPQVRFDPQGLYLTSRGRFYRPVDMIPLTPRWSEYQLAQRDQQVAIYLFEEGIAWFEPLTVAYATASSDQWGRTLDRLEAERARVFARAARARPDSTPP